VPTKAEVAAELARRGTLSPRQQEALAELQRRQSLATYRPAAGISREEAEMAAYGAFPQAAAQIVGQAPSPVDVGLAFGSGVGQIMELFTSSPDIEAGVRKMRESITPGKETAADLIAGLIPATGAAGKAAALPKTVNFWRRMGTAATEAAAASQLPYQSNAPESRATVAAGAAVLGPAFQAVGATKPMVRNWFRSSLQERRDPVTKQLIQEARAGWFPEDFDLAQAAGDPRVNQFAREAVDIEARDALQKQGVARIKTLTDVANSLGADAPLLTNPEWARAFSKVVRNEVTGAQAYASKTWRTDMERMLADPAKAVAISTDDVLKGYTGVQARFTQPFALATRGGLGKKLQDSIDTLEALKASGVPEFNMYAYRDLVEGINSARAYTTALPNDAQAETSAFLNQLMETVESAADRAVGSEEGVAAFRGIRAAYATRQRDIRRIKQTAVYRLFKDPSKTGDQPEKALDAFLALEPAAQRESLGWLREANPSLVGVLKKRYLDNAVLAAVAKPEAAMVSRVDMDSLITALENPRVHASGLFSEAERNAMTASAKNLLVIKNALPDVTRPGTPLTFGDFAINLISMTPAFMARLVARTATGTQLGKLIYSAEGRKLLTESAESIRTGKMAASQASLGYLMGLLAADSAAVPQPESPNAGR
jgi:hypothetical protein